MQQGAVQLLPHGVDCQRSGLSDALPCWSQAFAQALRPRKHLSACSMQTRVQFSYQQQKLDEGQMGNGDY